MSGVVSEYEFEALPELGAGYASYTSNLEGDRESEQFFGALANLARRGVGWLTAPGSPQRQAALTLARQAINQGLPALGQWGGGQAASWLGGLLPQQEYEWEGEFEISPIRKIYPDAMMEHLGHAAAEAYGEAEAESLAGAMIPLAARVVPQAAPTLTRAMPAMVSGVAGVVRRLHRDPATRPLVRVVPTIVRRTGPTSRKPLLAESPSRRTKPCACSRARYCASLEAHRPARRRSGVPAPLIGNSTAMEVPVSCGARAPPALHAERKCGRPPWTTRRSTLSNLKFRTARPGKRRLLPRGRF